MITQKVFTHELEDRIDPFYYKPSFMKRYQEINRSKYKKVDLEDVITDLKNGVEIRQYSNKGFRYLRVTDLDEFGINDNSPRLVDVEEIPPRVKLTKRDVLISRSGSLGLLTAVKDKDLDSIISSHIFKVRLDTNKILPEFLELYLRSKFGQFQFFQKNNGGIVPEINQSALKSITVILPPLDIQKKLIEQIKLSYQQRKNKLKQADEILNSIDDFVRKKLGIDYQESEEEKIYMVNSHDLENNRQDPYYYNPKFAEALNSLSRLKYKTFSLGQLMVDMSGGATPRLGTNAYSDKEKGVPFLRVQNITEKGILLEDVKYIKKVVHDGELKRSQLKGNDLVFTITGRIGSVAVVPSNFIGNINQHSVRIQLKDSADGLEINTTYVANFLNSSFGKLLTNRGITGGTRPALDYEYIKTIPVPIPDIEIQNAIAKEFEKRIGLHEKLKTEASELIKEAKKQVEELILD